MEVYTENVIPLKVKCLEVAWEIVKSSEGVSDPELLTEATIKIMNKLLNEAG